MSDFDKDLAKVLCCFALNCEKPRAPESKRGLKRPVSNSGQFQPYALKWKVAKPFTAEDSGRGFRFEVMHLNTHSAKH